MSSYWQILRHRPALLLLLSAFPGRLAYGMVSLSIYFKVQHASHSIATAGLAVGLNGLAGALTAGPRSSLGDRFGILIPLRILVPGYSTLLFIFGHAHGNTLLVLLAFVLGFSAPPINLSVRPLWKISVPHDWLRATYAVDTAVMSISSVIGPVIATTLSLSTHPSFAIDVAAIAMFCGGIALNFLPQSREWVPEPLVTQKRVHLIKVPAMRLMMIEGSLIGLGIGAFEIAVPATATLHHVPHMAGRIFSIFAIFNILGSLAGGLITNRTSPLKGFITTYSIWVVASSPLFFTSPNWTLLLVVSLMGFANGAQQVFYWEITELIRPRGSAISAQGWLWTVEGSFMAAGSTIGGVISQHFGVRWTFLGTTIFLILGLFLIMWKRDLLQAANRVPSSQSDLQALADLDSRERQ